MGLNKSKLIEIVLEHDYLCNRHIRAIYNCAPSTATRILKKIYVFAEEKNPGITKSYVFQQVPSSTVLDYLNTTIDDLIKYEQRKQRLQQILDNKKSTATNSANLK